MATKFLFKTAGGNYLKLGSRYAAIPDPSLYVNDTYIPFVPAGSFQDVSVLATLMNSWNPSSGAASWLTFSSIVNSAAEGNGWGSFRVSAASNSVSNRTGTISVISRFNTWEIDVSQNKEVVLDSISINPEYLSWEGDLEAGETKSTYVTSSGAWTALITSDPNGIVTSHTPNGAGSQTAYITVDNPAFKLPRYAEITYATGTASVILYLCISGETGGLCAI
jgi:hypothetical protein